MSQIKLQQLRCILWGSNWNKVAHEILTQSVCTVADWCWCRPLFAKAHMEVSLIFLISQFFSSLWNLVAFQSITTFCLLFKFDNEAKSYLGGWCSDVLLRLSTSYLFILSILFGGQTLNTLVDGPVMYSFSRTSSSSRP